MTDYQYLELPDAPSLPGLAFRRFADVSDFAAMVAIIEACQDYDQVDPLSSEAGVPTVAELKDSFSQADNIDLAEDMLLVSLDGTVIGFQWVRWWTQADDTWIYYHRGRVTPRWRGHGIGTATLRWAENRIRQLVQAHGTVGRAVFQANTTSREATYNELLVTEGYTPVHSFIELGYDESHPLPQAEMPAEFELRPATPADYRAIWQANEEAFVDEWGHRRTTDEDYIKFLGNIVSNPGFDPALWQIAWHGDEVAGVALSEIRGRGVGEISELSVREAWRGQGLARALLVGAVRALQQRDVKHIRIFTDAADAFGARSLYESVGFRSLTEYIRYQKPVELT
ncbi:MAG: GNAT family N-acetyltransferase [Anaerolineae bacterium]|nr:GNAT family N-acetyltransferase [Anaerolineae bacterium]